MKKFLTCLISKLLYIILLETNYYLFIVFFTHLFFNSNTLYGQNYFSPNPNVKLDQNKVVAFIKATPEIPLKAEFYNVSTSILETILVLQSNAGTTISDGLFNYSRVLSNSQLTIYPAFKKAKNGFVICTTRSRGVEATALSLSLLRNDEKKPLSDAQWLTLAFGPKGDLASLATHANEIFTARTGKSFYELGLNFGSNHINNTEEKELEDRLIVHNSFQKTQNLNESAIPVNELKPADSSLENASPINADVNSNKKIESEEVSINQMSLELTESTQVQNSNDSIENENKLKIKHNEKLELELNPSNENARNNDKQPSLIDEDIINKQVQAPDIIVTKKGNEIQAKILEISSTEIKYKKFDNQDGPTFILLISDIYMIKYSNGSQDIYNTVVNSPDINSPTKSSEELSAPENVVDELTNEKIIKLSKLGLPPTVIINKIQTSKTIFDVSTDGLIKLSENGVSGDVINEMMKTVSNTQNATANIKDINDPKTMRKTGIYYFNALNIEKPIKRVDANVTSTNKSGGFGTALAQAYSYGMAKDKLKSDLAGKNSRLQIDENSPVFYFYFENNSNPNVADWFFATATSPNEFVLVKLREKKDSREMVVGDTNAYGSSVGISNKIKIPYDYEEVEEGIFKVTFKKPLEKGEYCFLYASSTPTQYSNNKVFDFGISVGKK